MLGRGLAGGIEAGNLPLILAVVEDRRVGHVERREHRRLDGEDLLRVAQPRPQRFGHGVERLQQAGEDLPNRARHRIRRIDDVVGGRAVVGVDRDLDRVADVVEAAAIGGRRVRIAARRRIGVLHPDEAAVGDGEIRSIVAERRHDARDALRSAGTS